MTDLQNKYDILADKLKELQNQKKKVETDAIVDAYIKSSKSFDEIMTFLNP